MYMYLICEGEHICDPLLPLELRHGFRWRHIVVVIKGQHHNHMGVLLQVSVDRIRKLDLVEHVHGLDEVGLHQLDLTVDEDPLHRLRL